MNADTTKGEEKKKISREGPEAVSEHSEEWVLFSEEDKQRQGKKTLHVLHQRIIGT